MSDILRTKSDKANNSLSKRKPFSWLPDNHPAIKAVEHSKIYKDVEPDGSIIPLNRPQQYSDDKNTGLIKINETDASPSVIRGERLEFNSIADKPVYIENILIRKNRLFEVLELSPRNDKANPDSAIIDTCTISLKISRYHEYAEFFGDEELIELINRDLQLALGLKIGYEVNPRNNYHKTRELRHLSDDVNYKNLGFVAWGGNNNTVNIHITGEGCEHVSYHGLWERYAKYLELLGAKITRVDLAHDDLEGEHTIDDAAKWFKEGGFNAGGRAPTCSLNGDWLTGEDTDGRTLYVGKRENGKQMCVYEKGKQLKSAEYPNWVRFEGRLGSKSRLIPYDTLTKPGQYLSAMYPCLDFISKKRVKIKTIIKAKVKATVYGGIENCRYQYGSYVLAARAAGISDQDLCNMLVVDKEIPKHLVYPPSIDLNRVPDDIANRPNVVNSPDPYGMSA